MMGSTAASVKAALQRARATLDAHVPAGTRDRAPLPDSPVERGVVGRFADAVERGDIEGIVALLTEDGWLTMPPEPYEYQGHTAIGGFLHERAAAHGGHGWLRLVPTRANGQPAFGCYAPDPAAPILRSYGLMALALDGDRISAITWFGDRSVFPYFGLPRTLPGVGA